MWSLDFLSTNIAIQVVPRVKGASNNLHSESRIVFINLQDIGVEWLWKSIYIPNLKSYPRDFKNIYWFLFFNLKMVSQSRKRVSFFFYCELSNLSNTNTTFLEWLLQLFVIHQRNKRLDKADFNFKATNKN